MLDDRVHGALFSDSTIKLGEIHGTILKSLHIMEAQRWIAVKKPFGSSYEFTEFGKQVGLDEIHWWIFQKETDPDELLARTEEALSAAQALKTDSAKLKGTEPESYEGLLLSLRDFADSHRAEIDCLHRFVGLLEKRDAMAPRILFTYRVWGSTRMSDREMRLAGEDTVKWSEGAGRALAEIVLGVRQRGDLVYCDTYRELAFEIYESLDPEQMSGDPVIVPPEGTIIRRTGHAVYDNCATYFSEIRDSLRNIQLDIGKFNEQRDLYESDEFWRRFLLKACQVKTSEPQLWDFKETLRIWHVKDDPERRKAKVTLAEDVASFANVAGGVLVVGV
jgi:hypothetical protein